MPSVSPSEWASFLQQTPNAHFLQTAEWGELKSAFGWEAERIVVEDAGLQVLLRRLPLGLAAAYVPKPQLKGASSGARSHLVAELDELCRKRRAVFCKIEPDEWIEEEEAKSAAPAAEQDRDRIEEPSPHSIQPRRTVVVDLRGSDEAILMRMKPKCRYTIGLAQKKSVSIEPWRDVDACHRMVLTTGTRDSCGVHSAAYYRLAFELFSSRGMAELLVARYDGRPLAALMVLARGQRAWYVYGASTDEERNRMPNYLLQWEAMRWARQRGCEEYDLWGVPDEDEPTLEANFEQRHDGLWGVYRFKRGFGGELTRAAGARDRVYMPLLYRLYRLRTGHSESL